VIDHRMPIRSRLIFIFIFLSTIVVSCQGKVQDLAPVIGPQASPFLPPTVVSQKPAASTPAQIITNIPRISPTPTCIDNLTFQDDLTIKDGTKVTAGTMLDKRWHVTNSGSCNWDNRYRLKLIAGSDMSAPVEQALYPARSGTSIIIRIIFTAPAEPGTYRSAWQAFNPNGEAFGDPFFIEIVVKG